MIYRRVKTLMGIKVPRGGKLAYLHDIGLSVDHRLDEDGITEGALPDDLELPVLFHIKFK
jgi:hypothetical protein